MKAEDMVDFNIRKDVLWGVKQFGSGGDVDKRDPLCQVGMVAALETLRRVHSCK